MPEGHTIHRLARLHRTTLVGRAVAADSPQGRFADGAARIDGCTVVGTEAYGKHLFHRYAAGAGSEGGEELTLHVHLGLFGRWRTHRPPGPPPTPGTRLRLRTEEALLHLAGPTACELVDPQREAAILARLGPDPLRDDADPERAWAALQRRRSPVGASLMDQSVLAGVGNVYRAEALFVCGIHPDRPAREVSRAEWERLWSTIVAMLRSGERAGRIITVEPAEVGASSASRIPPGERTYVYRRAGEPCRRCSGEVRRWDMANRRVYACDVCQR
jgi:endonuclease VIII